MATINITVRDMSSECPLRKILSLKRTKMDLIQISGQKTGHDLENIVGNIVTKMKDASTEYDVSIKKKIGGINFVIRGKIDILLRKTENNEIIPHVIELKYNPLFEGEPLREHIRQVAIYTEMLRHSSPVTIRPRAYLQYWLVQDEDLAKLVVMDEDYPDITNPFVKTFKIENTRKIFNEALFDIVRAIAWKENFPGISPFGDNYCISCPYRRACTQKRLPEYSKLYNIITYDKYKKYGTNVKKYGVSKIPKDEIEDLKNYIKDVILYARNLKL